MLNYLRKKMRSAIFPLQMLMGELGSLKFSRVLDIGAGTGYFLENLQKFFPYEKAFGVEVTPSYFRELDRNTKIGDANELNPDEKYDLIVFNDVLHHINHKPKIEFIKEYTEKHLSKDGHILIKDMSPENLLYKYWNRLHDLIFAQELINEIHPNELESGLEGQYKLIKKGKKRIFLYDHYYFIFRNKA